MHNASSNTRPTPARGPAPGARRALVAGLGIAILAGCGGEGTGPEQVASLVVSPSSATVASRAPLPLTASAKTAGGKTLLGRPIVWSSSDTALAKVSATGLVTAGAVLVGTPQQVIITASTEGVNGASTLSISPVPVATVAASPPTANVGVGATQQFTAALADSLALVLSGRTIAWSSSDTSVATVDNTGLVTTRPYGGGAVRTTTISATSEGRTGSATLSVAPLAVASLAVAADSVAVGDTKLLSATLLAGSGVPLSGRVITWTSSDTTVALVNPAGLAIPVQRWDGVVRTVTITAVSEGVSGNTTLKVLPAPVGSITIEPGSGTLASGAVDTLVATPRTISGVILAGRTVTWQSANPATLAVDAQGVITAGTVTGGATVPVTITATSDGFSAPAQFGVLPSPVAAVTFTPDSIAIFPRQTAQLQLQITNQAGTPLTGRAVTYATSDPTIATVSTSGLVTAPIYVGTDTRVALITATAEGRSDTARVVVEPTRVVSIVLSPSTMLMPAGAAQHVGAVLRDGLGEVLTDRATEWSSSDSSVATVSDSGVVTMVGTGTATISASADGAFGTVLVSTLPVGLDPSTLVAGGYHHCALTTGGQAYCWGWNEYGQLGDGTSVDRDVPVAVAGGHTFASLSGGSLHTCGVTTGGQSYCWGWNANGQLGDGSHNSRTSPALVQTPAVFVSLAAGFYHSCGLTAAGVAYCWGRNNAAQLGDGTEIDRDLPAPVAGSVLFASLVGKYAHTCGLTPAGAAYCWGRNFHGAVGDSTIEHKNTPVPMLGGRVFTQIVMGWDHTCGLEADGEAYCLGRNQYGQLGNGQNTGEQLGFVRVIGVPALRDLQSGYYHMCSTTVTGEAWCWGRNHIGEIGDGATADRPTPVHVRPEEAFVRVGGGYGHACASTTDGIIECWGTLLGGVLGELAPWIAPADRPVAPGPWSGPRARDPLVTGPRGASARGNAAFRHPSP